MKLLNQPQSPLMTLGHFYVELQTNQVQIQKLLNNMKLAQINSMIAAKLAVKSLPLSLWA